MRDEARLVRPTHLGVAMPIHTTRAFVMKGALACARGMAGQLMAYYFPPACLASRRPARSL